MTKATPEQIRSFTERPATMGDVIGLVAKMVMTGPANEQIATHAFVTKLLADVFKAAADGKFEGLGLVTNPKLIDAVELASARRETSALDLMLGLETRIARLEGAKGTR